MITISGKSVFGGVSIGKLLFYQRNNKVIKRTHIDDVDAEWKRFQEAKDTAVDQLKGLYEKALADVGEANAMIFEIHQMMLEDLDYLESIENIIRTQEVNAEYAVATTSDNFAQMFAAMDDAYMQGRAADVKDVSERVLDILSGADTGLKEMTEPCIIAADDLAIRTLRAVMCVLNPSLVVVYSENLKSGFLERVKKQLSTEAEIALLPRLEINDHIREDIVSGMLTISLERMQTL